MTLEHDKTDGGTPVLGLRATTTVKSILAPRIGH